MVKGGLLVKALECRSKGPGFQSHLQQTFISLLVHSALPRKLSRWFTFVSFGRDIKLSVLGNPLKISLRLLGVSSLAGSSPVNKHKKKQCLCYVAFFSGECPNLKINCHSSGTVDQPHSFLYREHPQIN